MYALFLYVYIPPGNLTAAEHVVLFAGIRGVADADVENEVRSRLADVGLDMERNTATGEMSGGMRRRVSLALACVGDPAVVTLDEPTAGLDPRSKARVWAVVRHLKKTKAVVMTTHDMAEAEALADRVAIMVGGQLCAVRPTNR